MLRPSEEEMINTAGIEHTHPLFVGFLRKMNEDEKNRLVKNRENFEYAQGRCAMIGDILQFIDDASDTTGDM